jgi:hypothetical protein
MSPETTALEDESEILEFSSIKPQTLLQCLLQRDALQSHRMYSRGKVFLGSFHGGNNQECLLIEVYSHFGGTWCSLLQER